LFVCDLYLIIKNKAKRSRKTGNTKKRASTTLSAANFVIFFSIGYQSVLSSTSCEMVCCRTRPTRQYAKKCLNEISTDSIKKNVRTMFSARKNFKKYYITVLRFSRTITRIISTGERITGRLYGRACANYLTSNYLSTISR